MANRVYQLSLLFLIVTFFFWKIGFNALFRNEGHTQLVSGLISKNNKQIKQAATLLLRSDQNLDESRTAWRLSYVSAELGEYNAGAKFKEIAEESGKSDVLLNRDHPEFYMLEGEAFFQDENWQKAIDAYRRSLIMQPRVLDRSLYQKYYASAAALGNETAVQITNLLNQSNADTFFSISNFEISDKVSVALSIEMSEYCYKLTKLEYDQAALELGPLIPANLVWTDRSNGSELSQLQILVNLAPDAGFDWSQDIFHSYPHTFYSQDQPSISRDIRLENSFAGRSNVAGLFNSPEIEFSSYQSSSVQLADDQFYLMGAFFKSLESAGNFGVSWYGYNNDKSPYHFIRTEYRQGEWMFEGEIVDLQDNLEEVNLLLINYNTQESVLFDNLIFAPLKLPTCN